MLKARQRFDKYRIDRRIAQGGFADVYQAHDTVEGIKVALKIPNPDMLGKESLASFRKEVRLVAKLDHPRILPIKNACFINGLFVIVYPLGAGSLAERLARRLSSRRAINYARQILEALAAAHASRIIHCDVKPENFIVFPGDRLRLADFGLAKIVRRALNGSGSGTVGYLAPEQALGKPLPSSDVFSAGLIICRMLTGALPEWPYQWPPPNYARLRRKVHPDFVAFLRRALQVDAKKRFGDAGQMLAAFQRVHKRAQTINSKRIKDRRNLTWRDYRIREFKRAYGKLLGTTHTCRRCEGPVSEMMRACPWCSYASKVYRGETQFAVRCRRCGHGMKNEWKFCVFCYGAAQGPRSDRAYPDRRYTGTCSACGGPVMAYMHYCPWCRAKVRRGWKIQGSKEKCSSCGWGVLRDFWQGCPWCGKPLLKPL